MESLRFLHLAQGSCTEVVLSAERIIEVAKEVIHPSPLLCDWPHCNAELNSWKTLQEHIHQHCRELNPATSSNPGFLECPLPKCSGRFHSTLDDIEHHVDLSHLSRVLLPCPIRDCPLTFGRNAQGLPEHLEDIHKAHLNQRLASYSPELKPLRMPHHHQSGATPPLPDEPLAAAFLFSLPLIRHAQPQHGKAPTSSQRARRWKRMNVQTAAPEEESEDAATAGPFADLAPYDPRSALAEAPARGELLVFRRKRREPALQQSRPQHWVEPRRTPGVPPASIGYATFARRFGELEKAGIIDGRGVWPEAEARMSTGGGRPGEGPQAAPGVGAGQGVKKAAAGSL